MACAYLPRILPGRAPCLCNFDVTTTTKTNNKNDTQTQAPKPHTYQPPPCLGKVSRWFQTWHYVFFTFSDTMWDCKSRAATLSHEWGCGDPAFWRRSHVGKAFLSHLCGKSAATRRNSDLQTHTRFLFLFFLPRLSLGNSAQKKKKKFPRLYMMPFK